MRSWRAPSKAPEMTTSGAKSPYRTAGENRRDICRCYRPANARDPLGISISACIFDGAATSLS